MRQKKRSTTKQQSNNLLLATVSAKTLPIEPLKHDRPSSTSPNQSRTSIPTPSFCSSPSAIEAVIVSVKKGVDIAIEVVAMTIRQSRFSKEEFDRRGDEIYEFQVCSHVGEDHHEKIVAIDIETGAFEITDESLIAAKQLLQRHPDAQIFGRRIGHRAVHRFGFCSPSVST
jgi:hypothetical protein